MGLVLRFHEAYLLIQIIASVLENSIILFCSGVFSLASFALLTVFKLSPLRNKVSNLNSLK